MADPAVQDADLDRAFREGNDRDSQARIGELLQRARERRVRREQPEISQAPESPMSQAESPVTEPEEGAEVPAPDLASQHIGGMSVQDIMGMAIPGGDVGMQALQGVRDAVVVGMQNINAMGNWLREHGIGPRSQLIVRLPDFDAPDDTAEQIVTTTAQFLTGFLPGMKMTKALGVTGTIASGTVAGILADLSVMDPTQPQIADMIQRLAPEVRIPLVTFLTADPDDARAEQVFKQTIQGALTGALFDGVMVAARGMRAAQMARRAAQASGEEDLVAAAAKGIEGDSAAVVGELTTPTIRDLNQNIVQDATSTSYFHGTNQSLDVVKLGQQATFDVDERPFGDALYVAETVDIAQQYAQDVAQDFGGSARVINVSLKQDTEILDLTTSLGIGGEERLISLAREGATRLGDQEIIDILTDISPALNPQTLGDAAFTRIAESLPGGTRDIQATMLNKLLRIADIDGVRHNDPNGGISLAIFSAEKVSKVPEVSVPTSAQRFAQVKTADDFADVPLTETFEGIRAGPLRDAADETLELQSFIRKHGGMRITDEELAGELRALTSPKEVGTTGLMNDRSGLRLQEMAELAEQAGFIPTADKAELLEALDRSIRGAKVLSSMHPSVLGPLIDDPVLVDLYQEFKQIADNYDTLTETMVGGVRHLDDVTQEAQELITSGAFTLDDVRAIFPNQAMNDVQASAMVQSLTKMAMTAQRVARTFIETADQEDFKRMLVAMNMLGEMDPARMGVSAANSRALGVFRDPIRSFNAYLNQFQDMFDRAGQLSSPTGSTLTPRRFAEMLAELKSPQELAATARILGRTAERATLADVVQEAWISGLLSGPQTQAANMISNASVAAWAIPERFMAAAVGDVSTAQGVGMLFGVTTGMRQGFRLARRAFQTEEASFGGLTKMEAPFPRAISAESLEKSGSLGQAIDFLGRSIRLGPRLLMAGDEFFKGVNYQMQLHALAWDEAVKIAPGSGQEIGNIIAELVQNPTRSMRRSAENFAFYNTFTTDLLEEGMPFEALGRMSQGMAGALDEIPMGRVIAPFVRTPVNILRFSLERTPLGLLSTNVRRALAAGGQEAALARSKMMLGSLTMATAAAYAAEGRISGRGPSHPVLRQRKRETNWQPYSVRLGDTWVSYNRLDPAGQLFGIAADMTQILGEVDENTAARLAGAALTSVWQNLSSKTYMRGIANAFEVLAPTGWASPEQAVAPGERFVQRLAGSAVPTLFAQIARTADPTLREVREPGFMGDLLNTVYSRIPGYTDDLEPRLNFWAEPIVLGGGLGPDLISPLYTTNRTSTPVADEIVRLRLPLRMPTRAFRFADSERPLELTPTQYNAYVRLSNGMGVPGVPTLHDALERTMATQSYREASDGAEGGKARAVRIVVNQYRQIARQLLPQRLPGLGRELQRRDDQEQLQLVPEGPQREELRQRMDEARASRFERDGMDSSRLIEQQLGISR